MNSIQGNHQLPALRQRFDGDHVARPTDGLQRDTFASSRLMNETRRKILEKLEPRVRRYYAWTEALA